MSGVTSRARLACSGELVFNFQALRVLITLPFSFTGLTQPQTEALANKAHVYMTKDGRISMAGLNAGNIEHFATSVDAAVRGTL